MKHAMPSHLQQRRLSLVLLLVSIPAFRMNTVEAQVTTTFDDTIASTAQGAAPPGPPSVGAGNGFGGMIGIPAGLPAVRMAWDADIFGNASLDVLGGACMQNTGANFDVAVVYTGSRATPAFTDTTTLNDVSSPFAAAVSGNGQAVPGAADLFFGANINPSHAIAYNYPAAGPPVAFLFRLVAGGAHVVTALTTTALPAPAACGGLRISGMTLAQLGAPTGALTWVATVLNATNAFRSNEFHGVAIVPVANIGVAPHPLMFGDFNLFTPPDPVFVNELDADNAGTDGAEFIELFGTAGARLDGAVLTLFNGAGDASYRVVDLDGAALAGDGFFVAGSGLVPNVDMVIGTTNIIQNGADAVALYLGNAADFPSGTGVTTTGLVDALAYDTGDGDDAGLLSLLEPGEPQVDEAGGAGSDTESIGRCADGSGGLRRTSTYSQDPPTPGAANACVDCGDGMLGAGEDCDDGPATGTPASCCDSTCGFKPMGDACGAAPSGGCDLADVCNGAGVCVDVVEAGGTECRASAGICDVAESCDGAMGTCPVDGFAAGTTECRAAAGVCDVAERCTGSTPACPADGFVSNGTSCADALVCDGTERCMGGACVMGAAIDCDDGDVCTMDACVEPGACDHDSIAGCCNVDVDCDDGDLCTADACSGAGGTCTLNPITDCCIVATDCDDGNDCTLDACDGSNRCMRSPVPGCCSVDADCDDGNACTADACDVVAGECANTPVADCCAADGDCDDGNTCTMDACDLGSLTCSHDTEGGCCIEDAECDDADVCTIDACNPDRAECESTPIDGCGDAGMPDLDGGDLDGGTPDSGADASFLDGGGTDAGTDAGEPSGGGGCGCSTPDASGDGLSALLVLWVFWRRRR